MLTGGEERKSECGRQGVVQKQHQNTQWRGLREGKSYCTMILSIKMELVFNTKMQ